MRSSHELSDEVNYGAQTLPKMDNLREDVSDISSKNYPYLLNSTYSLPRNHRLYKSKTNTKRRYTSTFRESQESLLSQATENHLYPESRETLLNRYPSSGRNTPLQSPSGSRPSSPSTSSYGLQPSYSTSSFPSEYQQQPVAESSSRGYQSHARHWAGYHTDYDYRRSAPVSPRVASPSDLRLSSPSTSYSRRSTPTSQSRKSSRASSPHLTGNFNHYSGTEEYIRRATIRLHEVTSPPPPASPRCSRVSSARSSRASSPQDQTLERLLSRSDPKTKIVYVRETFQVIPAQDFQNDPLKLPLLTSSSTKKVFNEEPHLLPDKIRDIEDINNEKLCDKPIPVVSTTKSDKSVMTDVESGAEDDNVSVVTLSSVTSSKKELGSKVDLSSAGLTNIEEMLESLSRRVRSDKDLVDNDDSARAESVASLVSSSSSKGQTRDGKQRLEENSGGDKEAHSVIRRQSVIIEGLTLETDELKRRCQMLEDEIGVTPVEDLQGKLVKMEGKLEETENYCYQVTEENVELKTEIENLESEIAEVQDTFRDKDAKEFKKTKWELENLSKTCRNLQLKLGKAQARASRLRQEKEEIEEQQREQKLWKTTAVMAAAALAVFHLVNKYK